MKLLLTSLLLISTISFSQKSNTSGTIKVKKEVIDTSIYSIVEKMPEFPGGDIALGNFIRRNLIYPDSAKSNGITGTTYISFIINGDGSVSNVKTIRGIAGFPEFDKEARRVISIMPNWNPGLNKGNAVRVSYTIPINFNL